MMSQSKTKQYRCVSAGFALGLIMNDCRQFPNDKIKVEFAFTSAWRKWSHRLVLPSADRSIAGPRKDWDVIRIILDLDKDKKQPYVPFHWDEHAPGGVKVIVRGVVDFDPANAEDLEHYASNISEEIPADAWAELARMFLDNLATN